MTKVLQRVEETLRSFYIFNSTYGKKEGEEHKKILYYHPRDIEENTKIKDVGLSQAIIDFTKTFTAESDCKAMHTQKTTQLFYQPEIDFWMVLVVNVPKEVRTKDGIEVAEYRGGEVHDRIYHAMVEQCYKMFRLFAGTFEMNIKKDGIEQFLQKLLLFYDKYLLSLKLPACDVMGVTRSIQYLPLEKCLFLRAHNFINMICATFPTILETIFLYNDQIVCSGKIDPIDLHCLHEYIVGTIIPKVTQSDSGTTVLPRSNSTASDYYRNGAFITGPDNSEYSDKLPRVYMGKENALKPYYLVIYRALNATLCLFLNGDEKPNADLYDELHSYVGPQLIGLARDIGETLSKQTQVNGKHTSSASGNTQSATTGSDTAMSPKFLFINEQSLRHLSNIFIERKRPKTVNSLPMNVFNLIADLGNDENVNSDRSTAFEEVQVKTTNDFWIVKRRCNWRQYYVIIFNSKATLLDITQESKRIFEQELTDDVFFDN